MEHSKQVKESRLVRDLPTLVCGVGLRKSRKFLELEADGLRRAEKRR